MSSLLIGLNILWLSLVIGLRLRRLWALQAIDETCIDNRKFGCDRHNPSELAGHQKLRATARTTLLVLSSPHFTPARTQIAQLAIQHRMPTMFIFRIYVEAGGLLSYGADFAAM